MERKKTLAIIKILSFQSIIYFERFAFLFSRSLNPRLKLKTTIKSFEWIRKSTLNELQVQLEWQCSAAFEWPNETPSPWFPAHAVQRWMCAGRFNEKAAKWTIFIPSFMMGFFAAISDCYICYQPANIIKCVRAFVLSFSFFVLHTRVSGGGWKSFEYALLYVQLTTETFL
jgi:hypothetical protein